MSVDGRLLANIGVLAAVVEAGGFARAADALGLTPSGVSRAVARLESRIGVRLLDRTTRSMTLTDEGRRLYAQVGPLMSGIEDAVGQTSGAGTAVRGRLRVNVDAFFARMMLAPHLGEFLERHPALELDLVTREQLGDLIREGFDLAVRFGAPPSSSLVARRLLHTRTITIAAPAYLARRGAPTTPAGLADHACIRMRDSLSGQPPTQWSYRRGRQRMEVKIQGRLLVNEFGSMLGACLSAVGIARVKAIGVQRFLDSGQLVEVLPDWHGESFPLYALYPSRHLPAAKLRAFVDFVAALAQPAP
ncbi:LysR family transcriptional regulator [Lysobacter sp. CA199]|uniref:LysR family transcriptional regulator n=1 Tax=Lysobacter sp. CA199 TaxID=3455608 RepID=UPI003F8D8716